MSETIIETVTFKLAPGADEAAFIKASDDVNAFLGTCDGFIARRLSKNADGVWLDHVEWRNLADAKAAAETLPAQQQLAPFMAAIDMSSAKMRHDALMARAG